jgi:predicted RNA binding protein YcfA (HicA-like mRNA interferase family)
MGTVTTGNPVTGMDAIRMLLALGFRIGRSNGSVVALEKNGRIVFVEREGTLSEVTLAAILEAAQIGPSVADRLLARLRCRDTLPDTGGATP